MWGQGKFVNNQSKPGYFAIGASDRKDSRPMVDTGSLTSVISSGWEWII